VLQQLSKAKRDEFTAHMSALGARKPDPGFVQVLTQVPAPDDAGAGACRRDYRGRIGIARMHD
jgi:hypothetical protein